MKRALFLFLLLLAPPLPAQEAAPPPVAVSYTLDVTEPKSGLAKVEMVVENNRDDEVTVGIPVWAPGRYQVASYYLGIKDLEAEIAGAKVDVSATDHKSLWKVKTGGAATFKVRYTLKPAEVPTFRIHLTEDHYELQGPSAWLYVKDRINGPHKATFKLPEGWKVGTGLTKSGASTYEARDYDTFIDCPVELGKFALHAFEQEGVTYELVVHHTEDFAVAKLIDVTKKFVAEQTRMFGGAPFDRYVFIYHFRTQMGGAGLEHLNSTDINYVMSRMKDDPANIASLSAHEFFHLWNVKRIRPQELGPFDYTQPVRSKALWLSEGVTSYYGDLSLVRSGVWTREQYLNHLATEITELQANPVRKTQSVEQASWTVWDRVRGARAPAVDYYNKGELLGWMLDVKIRHATQGKRSFDDVMRHLYRSYVVEPSKAGKGPIGVGFPEDGILKAVNEVSGKDFATFFTDYVSGTEELPFADVAGLAGLSIARQKAIGIVVRDMAVRFEPPPESDLKKAGVRRGDKIVKINDTEVANAEQLAKALDPFKVGVKVTVKFTRTGAKEPILVELPVIEGPFTLKASSDSTREQTELLRGWLAPSK